MGLSLRRMATSARRSSNRVANLEQLEARRFLSTSVLRIVAYNIEDDINGNTTPLPGLYQVLEGIGEEKVAGNVRPIDILGLEETTNNADVEPIVTNLNSYYGSADVYAESTYQATQDGSNTDGNGPNALVYNTSTVKLLASVGVGTPEGSTNGIYRQPVRYEFQPVGDTGTTGIFYVYVMHTKSGTGTTNAKYRGEEAAVVIADEKTLPTGSSVIYEGDLNSNPPEAEFTDFEASGTSEAYDPFGYPTAPTKVQESDSATSLSYRDDYQLMTSPVYNDTGAINYVTGSFHNFANNGSVTDPASSSNTALNSDLVTDGGTFIPASTIYTDIGTASDHLPVVSDYTITTSSSTPVIGSFAVSPTSVTTGGAFTLTASNVTDTGSTITGVKFYEETNGTGGLQIGGDTLIGSGTQSGTTWSLGATAPATAGTYTYYAVATDANNVSTAASSANLTVTKAVSTPVIGSFTLSPTSVSTGGAFTLTASNVTDTGSTITGVAFYEETNGTGGLQIGSDTLVGAGTQSGTTWSLPATAPSAAGTYTYYAVATDANGTSTAASTANLTVTSSGGGGTSGTLLAWSVTGQTGYGTQGLAATTVGPDNTNSTGLTRGSGVTTSGSAASNAWGGANWASTSSAGISGNEFVTFALTVDSGDEISLSSIAMNYRRSSTGPSSGYWQYEIGTGAWTLIGDESNEFSSTSSSGSTITPISLTGISGLQDLAAGTKVTLRLIPYGATSSSGTWYVYDESGNDLTVAGVYGGAGSLAIKADAASLDVTKRYFTD
jgi:hypothetical protein